MIETKNKENKGYKLGLNMYADLSLEEVKLVLALEGNANTM